MGKAEWHLKQLHRLLDVKLEGLGPEGDQDSRITRLNTVREDGHYCIMRCMYSYRLADCFLKNGEGNLTEAIRSINITSVNHKV